jgi:hypothetical protein
MKAATPEDLDVVDPTGSNVFSMNPRSLRVRPNKALTRETWAAAGVYLAVVHTALQWWVGDWLNLGEARFGEEHHQDVPDFDVEPATLQQYAWVAGAIPAERRIYDLAWSVYREVADLPAKQQQRWLARAEKGDDGTKWTAAHLARAIREAAADDDGGELELWIMVRCKDAKDRETLLAAMEVAGRAAKALERRPRS